MFKISWKRVDRYMNEEDCFGAKNVQQRNATRISEYKFEKDSKYQADELSNNVGIMLALFFLNFFYDILKFLKLLRAYFANMISESKDAAGLKRGQFEELVQKVVFLLRFFLLNLFYFNPQKKGSDYFK